ncbi:hypothetical protein [Spiroplasma endosymbiont of Nomada ruficornis]|uniref:hypothetical protein n=1 Tax=Spiroplasma endosymbiont of Nomada ruficornis TaxID=3066325 RepID=UPI00313CC93B
MSNKVKRPMNAYMLLVKEKAQKLFNKNQNLNQKLQKLQNWLVIIEKMLITIQLSSYRCGLGRWGW